MKAIIFAGIGLFAAATIYGITDFAADKKKGTLDKLYKEEPAAPAAEEKAATAVTVEKTTVPSGVAVNSKSTLKKTTAGKKPKKVKAEEPRFIKLDDFSRGRIVPKVVKTEAPTAPSAELKKEEE
jgi:hypothetical protein